MQGLGKESESGTASKMKTERKYGGSWEGNGFSSRVGHFLKSITQVAAKAVYNYPPTQRPCYGNGTCNTADFPSKRARGSGVEGQGEDCRSVQGRANASCFYTSLMGSTVITTFQSIRHKHDCCCLVWIQLGL